MHISRREFIVVSATGTVTLASTACGGSNRAASADPLARAPGCRWSSPGSWEGVHQRSHAPDPARRRQDGDGQTCGATLVAAGNVAPAGSAPSETQGGRVVLESREPSAHSDVWRHHGHEERDGPAWTRGRNKNPRNPASHKDVTWVADMSRIPGAGSGRINPQCLEANPTVAKVASRVRFNGGEVAARFRPPFHQVVFEFGDAEFAKSVQAGAGGTLTFSDHRVGQGDLPAGALRRFGARERHRAGSRHRTATSKSLSRTCHHPNYGCKNSRGGKYPESLCRVLPAAWRNHREPHPFRPAGQTVRECPSRRRSGVLPPYRLRSVSERRLPSNSG